MSETVWAMFIEEAAGDSHAGNAFELRFRYTGAGCDGCVRNCTVKRNEREDVEVV